MKAKMEFLSAGRAVLLPALGELRFSSNGLAVAHGLGHLKLLQSSFKASSFFKLTANTSTDPEWGLIKTRSFNSVTSPSPWSELINCCYEEFA